MVFLPIDDQHISVHRYITALQTAGHHALPSIKDVDQAFAQIDRFIQQVEPWPDLLWIDMKMPEPTEPKHRSKLPKIVDEQTTGKYLVQYIRSVNMHTPILVLSQFTIGQNYPHIYDAYLDRNPEIDRSAKPDMPSGLLVLERNFRLLLRYKRSTGITEFPGLVTQFVKRCGVDL